MLNFFKSRLTRCDAPPPPTDEFIPLPADSKEQEDLISKAAKSARATANPGPFEQVHADAKRYLVPDTFDGAKIEISKQLSPLMSVVHNFHLGNTQLPPPATKSYAFSSQIADELGIVMVRADLNQNIFGVIQRQLHSGPQGTVNGKLTVQTSPDGSNSQLMGALDYAAPTFSSTLTYGAQGGGNLLNLNYLQAVTPSVSLGLDATYVGANDVCVSGYCARYVSQPVLPTDKSWMACLQYVGAQGAVACHYKRTISPNRVNLACELQVNPASGETHTAVGAEFNLKQSKVNLLIKGDGGVQSTLEVKLGPQSTLLYSAEVNQFKDEWKFGYGITIGS